MSPALEAGCRKALEEVLVVERSRRASHLQGLVDVARVDLPCGPIGRRPQRSSGVLLVSCWRFQPIALAGRYTDP